MESSNYYASLDKKCRNVNQECDFICITKQDCFLSTMKTWSRILDALIQCNRGNTLVYQFALVAYGKECINLFSKWKKYPVPTHLFLNLVVINSYIHIIIIGFRNDLVY